MYRFLAFAGILVCSVGMMVAEEIPAAELVGKVVTNSWLNLKSSALPEYLADKQTWPRPIPSTPEGLEYRKVSGTGYATANGIYAGGSDYTGPLQEKLLSGKVGEDDLKLLKAEDFQNVGRFEITCAAAEPGLKSVAFTIRLKGFPPGEKFTAFELTQKVFPLTLSYNGATQNLPPTVRKVVSVNLAGGFPEETYAVAWDVGVLGEPVRDFAIRWAVYPHALTTGLRVDQSDEAVPAWSQGR